MKVTVDRMPNGIWVITTSRWWGLKVDKWVRIAGPCAKIYCEERYSRGIAYHLLDGVWFNQDGEQMSMSMINRIVPRILQMREQQLAIGMGKQVTELLGGATP